MTDERQNDKEPSLEEVIRKAEDLWKRILENRKNMDAINKTAKDIERDYLRFVYYSKQQGPWVVVKDENKAQLENPSSKQIN